MTAAVLLGLSLQLVAVIVMHAAVRGQWLRHFGALYLLMAVLYQGLSEVMQWVFPGRDFYRYFVSQDMIDSWIVLVSVAMLVYTVAYAVSGRLKDEAEPSPDVVKSLHLWWLIPLMLPLVFLTLQGRGTEAPQAPGMAATRNDYLSSGLAGQFLVLAVAVVGVVAVIKYGSRWTLPILAAQVIVLSLVGARALLVIVVVLTLYGLSRAGGRAPRKQLLAAALVIAVLAMSISAFRAAGGRTAFASGSSADDRLSALQAGLEALPSDQGRQGILNDLVYRFDGNSFGALVLNSLSRGAEPVGLTTATNDVMLAVPSFLSSNKLYSSSQTRNEENYFDSNFGLPNVDYLPGLFGTLIGYYGALSLILLSALVGFIFRRLDVFVLGASTTGRLLLGVGLVNCAMLYEQGVAVFPISLRGVLLFVFVIAGMQWVYQERYARYRPSPQGGRPLVERRGRLPRVRKTIMKEVMSTAHSPG